MADELGVPFDPALQPTPGMGLTPDRDVKMQPMQQTAASSVGGPNKRVKIGDQILEFPPNMSEQEIQGAVNEWWTKQQYVSPGTELKNVATGLLKGFPAVGQKIAAPTVGWSGAILGSLMNGPPKEGLQAEAQKQTVQAEKDYKKHERKAPTQAEMEKIAGGAAVLGPLGATGAGARALGITGPIMQRPLWSGATTGAMSAADSIANERGDPTDALMFGGALGAAIPAVSGISGRFGTKAGEMASRVWGGVTGRGLGTPEELAGIDPQALFWASRAAKADGLTDAQIAKKYRQLGPRGFMGEYGEHLLGLTRAARDMPGGRQEIQNAFDKRATLVPEAHSRALDKALGPRVNTMELVGDLKDEARQSGRLYDTFRRMQVPITPELRALLPRLDAAGAFKDAQRLAAMEGKPWDATQFAAAQKGGLLGANRFPTAESWDMAKRAVDARIENSFNNRGEATSETRVLTKLKHDLIDAIEGHPDQGIGNVYKQAREQFAEPASVIRAIEMGKKWRGIDRDMLPSMIEKMSGRERTGFMQGMRADMADLLDDTRTGGTRITNTLLSRSNLERLGAVVGDAKTRALMKHAQQQLTQAGNKNMATGGSQTSANMAMGDWLKADPENLIVNRLSHMYAPHVTPFTYMIPKTLKDSLAAEQAATFTDQRAELARLLMQRGKPASEALRALLNYREPGSSLGPMMQYWTNLGAHSAAEQNYPKAQDMWYPNGPPRR